MENQILSGGMSNFKPIIDKLGDITTEFVPYITRIAVGILCITVIYGIVKHVIDELNGKSFNSFERF